MWGQSLNQIVCILHHISLPLAVCISDHQTLYNIQCIINALTLSLFHVMLCLSKSSYKQYSHPIVSMQWLMANRKMHAWIIYSGCTLHHYLPPSYHSWGVIMSNAGLLTNMSLISDQLTPLLMMAVFSADSFACFVYSVGSGIWAH